MNRKEQMLYLRKEPWTFQKIGTFYGISRQRVHQIVNNNHWTGRAGRPRHRDDGKLPWEED